MPTDEAVGARPLHLADDEHRCNFVDGFPGWRPCWKLLRMAGASDESQTGTRRLINLRYTKKSAFSDAEALFIMPPCRST